MSEPILSIQNLQVNYGGIEAVKGISFDVPEGEIVTLIGANGAGKSSTLRAISGLVKPKGGKILFRGEDITGKNQIVPLWDRQQFYGLYLYKAASCTLHKQEAYSGQDRRRKVL